MKFIQDKILIVIYYARWTKHFNSPSYNNDPYSESQRRLFDEMATE